MVCGKPLYFFQNHSGSTALPLSFRCMYLQCTNIHVHTKKVASNPKIPQLPPLDFANCSLNANERLQILFSFLGRHNNFYTG